MQRVLKVVLGQTARGYGARVVRRTFGFNKVKDFVVRAWKETYPDEDDHKKSFKHKVSEAKAEAVRAREEKERMESMTEEELAKFEEQIPEHRRRTLVFVKEEKPPEPLSARLKKRIYQYIKESTLGDELKKNNVSLEEFSEELDRLAEGQKTFKENVKNSFADSENEVTKAARKALESVNLSGTGKAIDRMRKVYPEFDIFELEDDTKEIFVDLYEAFLQRNDEYVQKVADGEARGFFLANMRRWEEMEVKPKFDKIWFFEGCHLEKADVVNSYPVFLFSVKVQEIDCLESIKEEDIGKDIIVQGSDKQIVSNTYIVTLTLHDEPDLEAVGHTWKITEFRLAGKQKMLL